MKKVNQYKFKNGKVLETCWIQAKDRKGTKIPDVDNILFHWSKDGGKSFKDGLYIRPDEALIIAKQLIDAVYKLTGGYVEKPLKGYYKYKEFPL